MQVTVERLVDPRKKIVTALSGAGRLDLVWKGNEAPTRGEHFVELDVPAILEWGREIWRASDGVPGDHPSRAQRVTGTLEGLDELGVATIRLADGYLLVETLGDPPLGTVGDQVSFETLDIHAFPVGY